MNSFILGLLFGSISQTSSSVDSKPQSPPPKVIKEVVETLGYEVKEYPSGAFHQGREVLNVMASARLAVIFEERGTFGIKKDVPGEIVVNMAWTGYKRGTLDMFRKGRTMYLRDVQHDKIDEVLAHWIGETLI